MTLPVATLASSWVSSTFPRAGGDMWEATNPGPIPSIHMGGPELGGFCMLGLSKPGPGPPPPFPPSLPGASRCW